MSDFDNEYELDNEAEEQETNPARAHQRKLEKELKEAKRNSAERDFELAEAKKAQRELALLKAGVDTSSGAGKLFAEYYYGELNMDAIKAQAEEYGLIATSQTAEIKQELSAMDRVSGASVGSSGQPPVTAIDDIRKATNAEEVLAVFAKHNLSLSYEEPGQPYSIV